MEQKMKWWKLDGTKVRSSIEEEVRQAIVREKGYGHHLKICIGTDSK